MYTVNKLLPLLIILTDISFAQIITDTTIDLFTPDKKESARQIQSEISIYPFSELYLYQSGIGSGYVGSDIDFKTKICWALGLRPEYNLNGHLFSVQFAYINKTFYYYWWPSVRYPERHFSREMYHYFLWGIGYGYKIRLHDLFNITIEIHVSDRMLFQVNQSNEFYSAPYISVNFAGFGIFFKENILLSRKRWESERLSSVIGIHYQIRLFKN